jgi:5-methyltetrahydropteroyltriglutamate--homocysteine methyltransferase
MDVTYREQFTDALSVVISDQERAGLDILTNGDYFLDEDVAGRSWHHYPLQRWAGLEGDYLQTEKTRSELLKYPPGTLLHDIYTSWRWPHVVDKIEPKIPLEYAKIWRIAQTRTRKPVKFGTVSSQVMGFFLDIHTDKYKIKDKREVVWDMSVAMNKELRQLAAAGCKIIQLEEPVVHFICAYYPEQKDYISFLVDAFNREVEGLDDVEIWIHTCWGNPNMQRVFDKYSYQNSIEIYLEKMKGDVWTIEAKDNNLTDLPYFKPFKNSMKKKIALGAVSHRSLQADRPEDVATEARKALQYIRPENLILSSDCGFGRQGCPRIIAFYKAAALAQGANIIRRELGLPETYVPAADPRLQMDIVEPE